jgi:hypothetical protein
MRSIYKITSARALRVCDAMHSLTVQHAPINKFACSLQPAAVGGAQRRLHSRSLSASAHNLHHQQPSGSSEFLLLNDIFMPIARTLALVLSFSTLFVTDLFDLNLE